MSGSEDNERSSARIGMVGGRSTAKEIDAGKLVDDSSLGLSIRRPRLIFIGSPEDGFAQAGFSYSLVDIGAVRFGRVRSGSDLEVVADQGVLHVAIPLAWVSGVHAQLNVVEVDGTRNYRLTDLRSSNGTRVENELIENPVQLEIGQVFEIGRSFWMIREAPGEACAPLRELDPTGTANPMLQSVHRTLSRLAGSDLSVMLLGETGVGKRHTALTLHRNSERDGEFVQVNVSSAPIERLLGDGAESLAVKARNGTVYFDELGELAEEGQARLLYLTSLLSAPEDTAALTRIIAGSTRDLRETVAQQRFRPDLYSRLSVYEAELPPLRERREDLGLLVQRFARGPEDRPLSVSTSAFRRIMNYGWPFNVRELRQTLKAAARVSADRHRINSAALVQVLPRTDPRFTTPARVQAVREELVRQLKAHAGDTAKVAEALACSRQDVHSWLERFAITPEEYGAWG